MSTAESQVFQAAANLVAAFGAHDVERYFASFAPDATFLFYTTPQLLPSREAYRREWASWEASSFRVLSCRSSDGHVQFVTQDVAVFTHRVTTRTRDADGDRDLDERETILFRRTPDGAWLGAHEHLSPAP